MARRTGRAVMIGALVAAGSVLGLAAPAQAHNYLVASTPAAGATLTSLPDQFSITTNEPLLDLSGNGAGFALQVVDAGGDYYGDGCVTVEGSSIYTAPALGAAGEYSVIWQVVSDDGHTVSEKYSFTWAPADGATPAEGSSTAPVCAATGGGTGGPAAPATAASGTSSTTDALWIGGALVAVGAGAGVALFVVRRKR